MNNKMKSNKFRNIILLLLIISVFAILLIYNTSANKDDRVNSNELIDLIQAGQVSMIYTQNGTEIGKVLLSESEISEKDFPKKYDLWFILDSQTYNALNDSWTDGTKTEMRDENGNIVNDEDGNPIMVDRHTFVWEKGKTPVDYSRFLMPTILIIVTIAMLIFVFRMLSRGPAGKSGMGIGKNKSKLIKKSNVLFKDVAGIDEEKDELVEIVDYLRNPSKYTKMGARIPKGILLVGRPGTGKTLLAKAIAGESEVPFFSVSGSDFVEMYVGVGASRVRDLFEDAKKNAPCIVFIDEIDAVGRKRGAGLGGGNDEREQTLNQLLIEMDGFEGNEGIIVMAATNRVDILDNALTRPGRFDRRIFVYPPDVKGREEILRVHAKNKPLSTDVDFRVLGRITSGFTGADIENLMNEAALLAASQNKNEISMNDITNSINKVTLGIQKKSRVITQHDKEITAYHESGHAILGKLLPYCDSVQEVSIIPRGQAAGYTLSRDDDEYMHYSKNKILDCIAMTMGGRIAESIQFGDITTGASNDIVQASNLARSMVTEWGMSDKLGFINYTNDDDMFASSNGGKPVSVSDKVAGDIDTEIQSIINSNYKRALDLLTANKSIMDEMVKVLLAKETIYLEDVNNLMSGKSAEDTIALMEEREKNQKITDLKNSIVKDYKNIIESKNVKLNGIIYMIKIGNIEEIQADKMIRTIETEFDEAVNRLKLKCESNKIDFDELITINNEKIDLESLTNLSVINSEKSKNENETTSNESK